MTVIYSTYTLATVEKVHYDDAPNLYYTLKTIDVPERYPQTTTDKLILIEKRNKKRGLNEGDLVIYRKRYPVELIEKTGEKCKILLNNSEKIVNKANIRFVKE